MPTAPAANQRRLLDVQVHESRLRALARRRAETLQDAELAAAQQALAAARAEEEAAEQERDAVETELGEVADKAAAVDTRIVKDEAALLAGNAGASTLQSLQREIESLKATADSLETDELEVMERLDDANDRYGDAGEAVSLAEERVRSAQAAVDAAVQEIDDEIATEKAARATATEGIDAALLQLYEKTLERYGTGAARLVHGTSEGSGMALSAGDLAEIRRAAPDAVVMCPDSGVILVRDPEWA